MMTLKEKHLRIYKTYYILLLMMVPICSFSTVTVYHRAPNTVVSNPARNSPWLFATNRMIQNSCQTSCGQCLSKGYSYRSCLYWERCPPLVWGIRTECSWIHRAADSVDSVQSVSESDFKPCRINISFFIWGLYRPMRSCWCYFASTHAI